MKAVFDPTGWFFVPEPRPSASVRLFCFSYAGGWPWAFRAWPTMLPDDVELYAICLPGRGRRANELAPDSIDALVTALGSVMTPLCGKPYALFGHSFGAIVAFELAGELERQGNSRPRHVFVSGCAPPGTHAVRPPLHTLPDDDLVAVIRSWTTTPNPALADPGVLAATVPLVRADLRLAELHRSRIVTLASPLTAFFGSEDDSAPRDAVAEWQVHAGGPFALRGIAGDHFFLHTHTVELLAAVYQGLT